MSVFKNTGNAPVRVRIAMLFVAMLWASIASADELNPERDRGFNANTLYQFNGVDNVNLFNGGLGLTIPLGSYPVAADVSYSFTLRYSNNMWHYTLEPRFPGPNDPPPDLSWAYNWEGVGLGWSMNFGYLESTRNGLDEGPPLAYRYTSPDGGSHLFYESMHDPVCGGSVTTNCDWETPGVWYTRDGSYLRLKQLTTDVFVVEFPDGQRHRIKDHRVEYYYGLSSTLDASGVPLTNWVKFEYPATPASGSYVGLIVTDSVGRRHEVDYAAPAEYDFWRFDKIRLAAPRTETQETGNTSVWATYDFVYDADAGTTDGSVPTMVAPCGNNTAIETQIRTRFLRRLILPTGESWEFAYDQPTTNYADCRDPGAILRAKLPTGGWLHWTWQNYGFGYDVGALGRSTGVKTRCLRGDSSPCSDTAAATEKQEQYQKYSRGTGKDDTTVETYELVGSSWVRTSKAVNYFDTTPQPSYGLPFRATATPDAGGRRLSTEIFSCSGATCTSQRREYVKFEWDYTNQCNSLYPCERERNRRLVSKKTEFSSDGNRTITTTYNDFDGLGHFRSSTTTSDFGNNDGTVETYTDYNSTSRGLSSYNTSNPATWIGSSVQTYTLNNGNRVGGMMMPEVSDPWFLGNYTYAWTTDSRILNGSGQPRKYYTEACFDPGKAFLYRKRSRKDETRGATDVITAFTRDTASGFVAREEVFGGDEQSVDTSAVSSLCTIGLTHTTGTYRIDHTYQHGVRKSSRYYKGTNSQAMPFFTLDNSSIDKNTGLVRSTRDVSGLTTNFTFDTSRRLTVTAPPDVASTTYSYTNASGSAGARVDSSTNAGTDRLATSWEYDIFGRVIVEKRLMPDTAFPEDTWSGRKTTYDSAGRQASVSETVLHTSSFNPTEKTTYTNYDPFGRVGTVRTADAKETNFTYSGVRLTTRSYSVAMPAGDTVVQVQEEFDRAGRLVSVTEDSTGSAIKTEYSYDPNNHLTFVHWPDGAAGQNRTFVYDGRGFLISETHPESGLTSYLYDAMGNSIQRTTAMNTLRQTYDRAGRLLLVNEPSVGDLKQFAYDRANGVGDYSLGKTDWSLRHNRSTEFGDVRVKETYTYAGLGGRLSKKVTQVDKDVPVTESFAFSDGYTYDSLGNLVNVRYPGCDSGDCTGPFHPPLRNITPQYQHGLVTSVSNQGGTVPYSPLIKYHPNGLVSTLYTQAGPRWDQTIANGMARPNSIAVTGFCVDTDFKITVQPQSQTVVSGGTTSLSVSTQGSGLTFKWFLIQAGVSQEISGQNLSTLSIPVTETSTFFVRVSQGTCSVDSERAIVTVSGCGSVSITAPSTVTTSTAMTASVPATSGATYAWTISGGQIQSGNGTSSITFIPTGCGSSVELGITKTVSGCPATATHTVSRPKSGTVSGSTTITAGASADVTLALSGAGPWTVTWSDSVQQSTNTSPLTRTVTPSSTTTYTATATDGFGCAVAISGSAVITVSSGCTAPPSTITAPTSVTTTNQMTASVPVTSGATYTWSIVNGQIMSGFGTSSITFLAGCSGSATTINVTVTKNGCSSSDDHVVSRPVPTATLSGSTSIAPGGTATITATLTGLGPWVVSWSDGNTQNASSSPAQHNVMPTITTAYSASVIDGLGCSASVSGSPVVTVRPPSPQNLSVAATSTTQVSITWTGSANLYRIYRDGAFVTTVTGTSYSDSGRTSGSAYVYSVTAMVGSVESLPISDVAAMFVFTDYPLLGSAANGASATPIKAAHITVLQNAVNAVRVRAGLSATTFPTITPQILTVQATHVSGLLDPLDDAREALGLARLFDSVTITSGMPIQASTLNAIRGAM